MHTKARNGGLSADERRTVRLAAERLEVGAYPFSLPSCKAGGSASGKRKSSTRSSQKDTSPADDDDDLFPLGYTPPKRSSSKKDRSVDLDDGWDGYDDNQTATSTKRLKGDNADDHQQKSPGLKYDDLISGDEDAGHTTGQHGKSAPKMSTFSLSRTWSSASDASAKPMETQFQVVDMKKVSTQKTLNKQWWEETKACVKQGMRPWREIVPEQMDNQINAYLKSFDKIPNDDEAQ